MIMEGMELIKRHEGIRLRCYVDTRGKRSIGFGRNLDDKGVNLEEALMLFSRDYTDALNDALTRAHKIDENCLQISARSCAI